MTDTTDPREGGSASENVRACQCHAFWPTHHPECPAMQAIRALEAKVRELDADKEAFWKLGNRHFVQALKNGESANELRADRDRLAGEVERLKAAESIYNNELSLQVARLTSELAAAREIVDAARPIAQHGTCATREEIANLAARFAVIDAARRAGEGEK